MYFNPRPYASVAANPERTLSLLQTSGLYTQLLASIRSLIIRVEAINRFLLKALQSYATLFREGPFQRPPGQSVNVEFEIRHFTWLLRGNDEQIKALLSGVQRLIERAKDDNRMTATVVTEWVDSGCPGVKDGVRCRKIVSYN